MSDISERLVVHCPDREASQHLAAFIADHENHDGSVRVPLRLPINMFADRRSLIERRVIATLYPLRSISDAHPTYSVYWSPKGGGPFPEFSGALAVEKSERDDCFGLVVTGHYDPPLGAVDLTLGRRIAHSSARDLLRSIADYVENACAHSAAARAGHSRDRSDRDGALHQKYLEGSFRAGPDGDRVTSVQERDLELTEHP
jgi:hypothetical protein